MLIKIVNTGRLKQIISCQGEGKIMLRGILMLTFVSVNANCPYKNNGI